MDEGIDHYFHSGTAPTNPLSVDFGGNVAEEVVADLGDWLRATASR